VHYLYSTCIMFTFYANFLISAEFGNGHLVTALVQKYEAARAHAGDGNRIIHCTAKMHGKQEQYNKAIITMLASTTHLPETLQQLIAAYIQSSWFLRNRFNIFNDGNMVCRIARTKATHNFVSYNEDKTRCKIWNPVTAQIIQDHAEAKKLIERDISEVLPRRSSATFELQPVAHKTEILSFTRCEKYRVMTDISKKLKLWSGASLLNAEAARAIRYFELKNNTIYGLPNVFLSSTFSLCCNYVAAGTLDGTVTIFDRETLAIQCTLSHDASVTALQVCSLPENKNEEQLLLAGLADGSLCVWQGIFNAEKELPPDTDPVQYHPAPSHAEMIDVETVAQPPHPTKACMDCCYSCILGCFTICRK